MWPFHRGHKLRDGSRVKDPRLGRIVQFDERSRNFPVRELISTHTPLTRHWKTTVVLDQGNHGSCVGNGWAHELIATPKTNLVDEKFAFNKIYLRAQQLDDYDGGEYPGGDGSEGSSVLGGAKATQELGYMREYRWCFSLQDVLLALNTGPVVLGTNWYDGMFETDAKGFVHPTGSLAGGHCYLVNANDVSGQFVEAHQSWGPNWGISSHGNKGQFKISWGDLDRLLHEDGEACVAVGRKVLI